MKRYEVIYSKRAYPCNKWCATLEQARDFANRLRLYGYGVDIWDHDDQGARQIEFDCKK